MFIVCSHVSETLVGPLQEKMDDWKKAATILDKDHAKGDLVFSFRLKVVNRMYRNTINNITMTVMLMPIFCLCDMMLILIALHCTICSAVND